MHDFQVQIFHALVQKVLTLWCLAEIEDFWEKNNTETHVALRGNFSGLVSATGPVKGSKDAASLLVCTRKNFFAWGCRFVCE